VRVETAGRDFRGLPRSIYLMELHARGHVADLLAYAKAQPHLNPGTDELRFAVDRISSGTSIRSMPLGQFVYMTGNFR
jgi:hypothetical protein